VLRLGLLAVVAWVFLVAPAAAAPQTHCVDPDRPDECFATIAEAIDAAAASDIVEVTALTETDPVVTAKRIGIVGAGQGKTILSGGLTLTDPEAVTSRLTTTDLDLSGTATFLRVTATAQLRDGATLQASEVDGTLRGAGAVLQTVLLRGDGAAAVLEACDGDLLARNVTVVGGGDVGAGACPGATLTLRDSIVWGTFGSPLGEDVTVDHAITDGPDPHLGADGRPAAGSPAIDAGGSAPLAAKEWHEDLGGVPRVMDGDGDGGAARDLGAFERAPAPVAPPAGNLLADPGAEDGGAWALGGGIEVVRYGLSAAFPSAATGAALGGGARFFAGGAAEVSTAAQRVDVSRLAPEIDRGTATARLAALIGGFLDQGDAGTVTAAFLGPAGAPLGSVTLAGPDAAERLNTVTLLPRQRTDPIPPLTRTIEVGLRAQRLAGVYDDASFDNLALTVSAPGAPPPPPPGGPPLKPFSGVVVLTAKPRIDRFGRVVTRMGCPDKTVGHCSGVVTVTRGAERRRVGVTLLTLLPGSRRSVKIRLSAGARRTLRRQRRLDVALYLAIRDAQGVTRLTTVPLVVRPRKKP
jgi:hypothetical protein